MTPVVEAQGSAVISHRADRWRLILRVQANSSEAEAAYRRRTRAVTTAQRVLSALPDTALSGERLEDSHLHHSGQLSAGWTGTVTGSVAQAEQLQELVSRLAGVEDVEISGPYWDLSAPAQRMAREEALEAAGSAARADAETIARALGGRCGELLRVSSQDHGMAVPRERITMMAAETRAGVGEHLPTRTLELELAPEAVEVTAMVAVSFAYLPD